MSEQLVPCDLIDDDTETYVIPGHVGRKWMLELLANRTAKKIKLSTVSTVAGARPKSALATSWERTQELTIAEKMPLEQSAQFLRVRTPIHMSIRVVDDGPADEDSNWDFITRFPVRTRALFFYWVLERLSIVERYYFRNICRPVRDLCTGQVYSARSERLGYDHLALVSLPPGEGTRWFVFPPVEFSEERYFGFDDGGHNLRSVETLDKAMLVLLTASKSFRVYIERLPTGPYRHVAQYVRGANMLVEGYNPTNLIPFPKGKETLETTVWHIDSEREETGEMELMSVVMKSYRDFETVELQRFPSQRSLTISWKPNSSATHWGVSYNDASSGTIIAIHKVETAVVETNISPIPTDRLNLISFWNLPLYEYGIVGRHVTFTSTNVWSWEDDREHSHNSGCLISFRSTTVQMPCFKPRTAISVPSWHGTHFMYWPQYFEPPETVAMSFVRVDMGRVHLLECFNAVPGVPVLFPEEKFTHILVHDYGGALFFKHRDSFVRQTPGIDPHHPKGYNRGTMFMYIKNDGRTEYRVEEELRVAAFSAAVNLGGKDAQFTLRAAWKDQGWGNTKGKISVQLFGESGIKEECYLDVIAGHDWTELESTVPVAGDVKRIDVCIQPGYGGGHSLSLSRPSLYWKLDEVQTSLTGSSLDDDDHDLKFEVATNAYTGLIQEQWQTLAEFETSEASYVALDVHGVPTAMKVHVGPRVYDFKFPFESADWNVYVPLEEYDALQRDLRIEVYVAMIDTMTIDIVQW